MIDDPNPFSKNNRDQNAAPKIVLRQKHFQLINSLSNRRMIEVLLKGAVCTVLNNLVQEILLFWPAWVCTVLNK